MLNDDDCLGGETSNTSNIFTSKFGEDFQFDEHIFQMGWFNHQPVVCWGFGLAFHRGCMNLRGNAKSCLAAFNGGDFGDARGDPASKVGNGG